MTDAERMAQIRAAHGGSKHLDTCTACFLLAQIDGEAREGPLARALAVAKELYDECIFDDSHMEECPQDDTCECEWVIRIDLLFAILEGNTEVEARLRHRLDEQGATHA